ncbi:unnamed protein product [Hymenolepis diminuta]|uniref:ER membrane protein complex subunit 10 n=1 Tax=Hymenolepis diminuta TaxID=6216 RepID=A0A0R3SC14_HYMDI|nr:unnamed protein product [Hymenolepis diminuta]
MRLPFQILQVSVLFFSVFAEDDFSSLNVIIEHSFDEGFAFNHLSFFSIFIVFWLQGKTFKPKATISSWTNGGITHLVKEPALTNEEQLLLAVLPPSFLNKPIEIVFDRLHVCYSRLHQTQFLRPNEFLSSCKFRHLLASDGKLALILSIDASGSLIAISAVARNQSLTGESGSLASPSQISTKVFFQKPALAIGPDTQEYLAKIERLREEKLRQEQGDNRSFFSKYWMYIVIIVILVMFFKAGDPNAAGE